MADKITAYKFLSSKHVDDFVSNGVLKLGAAGEFRKIEGTTGGRGDENELRTIWHADGRYELKNDDPFIVALTGAPVPAACNMPKLVIQGGPGVFINMDADGLLYCASSEMTPELAARMKSDFDADACVRISDFDEFIRLVATHPDVRAAQLASFSRQIRQLQASQEIYGPGSVRKGASVWLAERNPWSLPAGPPTERGQADHCSVDRASFEAGILRPTEIQGTLAPHSPIIASGILHHHRPGCAISAKSITGK